MWNTAANWSGSNRPDTTAETAAFGTAASNRRSLTFSANTNFSIAGISFNSGANAFTVTLNSSSSLTLAGAGIADTSGNTSAQSLVSHGTLTFSNSASAGDAKVTVSTSANTSNAFVTTNFNDSSSAGTAILSVTGSASNAFGQVLFNNTSTAASSTISVSGSNGGNGDLEFHNSSTAASSQITIGDQGQINFYDGSTAGSATVSANTDFALLNFDGTASAGSAHFTTSSNVAFNGSSTAGSSTWQMNASDFSEISFNANSTAGSATIALDFSAIGFSDASTAGSATIALTNASSVSFSGTANGGTANFDVSSDSTMDFSLTTAPTLTVGSITGSGQVYLGANQLQIGGTNASFTFSGQFFDGGGLTKVGTCTLTLSGNNQYTGPTNLNAGKLILTGSVASSSLTTVNSGATLAGYGHVGSLTVASGGTLAPGATTYSYDTLRAGNTTLYGGGTFQWQIDNSHVPFARWDQLAVTGALDLTNLFNGSGGRFNLSLQSLTFSDVPGPLAVFDPTANYSFTFLTTTGGITGFAANKFAIDTTGFQNPFTGTWSVSSDGFNLSLDYTAPAIAPVPEPGTTAACIAALALGAAVILRRRR